MGYVMSGVLRKAGADKIGQPRMEGQTIVVYLSDHSGTEATHIAKDGQRYDLGDNFFSVDYDDLETTCDILI